MIVTLLLILATPNSDSAEIRGKSWKRALHYGIAFRHYSFLCRRYITRRDSANVKRRRHTTCMHRICRLLGLVFLLQIFQRLFEHFIRCFLRLLTSVTMVFFCEAAQCWAHDSKRKNPDFSVCENSAQRTQALAPAGWDSIPEVVVTTRESENYLVSRISRFSYLFRVARIGGLGFGSIAVLLEQRPYMMVLLFPRYIFHIRWLKNFIFLSLVNSC